MKIRSSSRNTVLALGALALLGGSLVAAPARAQEAGAASDKPITLNLQNVPIQTALQLLFKSAGIRNYTIAPDVLGNATIQVQEIPFTTALNRLLSSVNATFAVDNGSYNVTIKRPTPPPAPIITPSPNGNTVVGNGPDAASTEGQPRRFYPIPINKYDAYYIALLLGSQGIVRVGVNDVIPAGQAGGGGQQGGQGGFGGGQGGFGGGGGGFGGLGNGVSSVGGGGGFGGGGGGFGGGGGGFGGGGRGGFGGGGGGFGGGRGFAIMNPSSAPSAK